MMDFYIINDEKPKPESYNALEFAGSIDYDTFKDLQKENIIEDRFDYYKDFRLENAAVKSKLDNMEAKNLKANSAVLKFIRILEKANEKNHGLLACCD